MSSERASLHSSAVSDDKMKLRLQPSLQGGLLGWVIVGGMPCGRQALDRDAGTLLGAYVGWCAVPS